VCVCVCVCEGYSSTTTVVSIVAIASDRRAGRAEVFLKVRRGGEERKTCIYTRPRGRYRRTRGSVKPGLSTRDRCAVNSKRIKLFAWGFVLFFF